MPRRSIKAYRKKRKSYKWRSRKRRVYPLRRPIKSSMGTSFGFPKQRVTKIRYCDDVVLTSSTGAIGYYVMRANDAYDPDYTGVGHTPSSYTVLAAQYNHCVCLGSRIWVRWTNNDDASSAITPTVVGVFLDDSATTGVSGYTDLVENGRCRTRILASGGANGYQRVNSILNYSAKKFFNVKDVKDNMERLGSPTNASPSEQAMYQLFCQNLGATSTTVQAQICIDYIMLWSEPKTI